MDYYDMEIRGDINQMNTKFDKVLLEMTRLKEDNQKLILQVTKKDKRISELEREISRNIVIMKRIAENENKNESETREIISKIMQKISVNVDNAKDILEIKRIGRFLKVVNKQTKSRMLKNAKRLKGSNIWIEKDHPRSVREERRNLITQMKEAEHKGQIAYINYNKLVIKDKKDEEGAKPMGQKITAREQEKVDSDEISDVEIDSGGGAEASVWVVTSLTFEISAVSKADVSSKCPADVDEEVPVKENPMDGLLLH
ncbi:hypothetical protein ILUMI_02197 [Ignelater luminosus]|uniref:Uncharacterized protein n=1 Tax=Ignelater luminosus TaxID=2038154 RepID=A0A8K0DGY5_IGNLU|nr:hypothetical protein ILUMI_02197 [Ignelater luminosus]